MLGWTHSAHPYTLPPGLNEGTVVTVIDVHGQDVTVRTAQGQEFILMHWLVDVGREWRVDTLEFLPETDPRALDHLEAVVIELRQRDPSQYSSPHVPEVIAVAERILARNGRGTPELPSPSHELTSA